jgi:hypothetical protein
VPCYGPTTHVPAFLSALCSTEGEANGWLSSLPCIGAQSLETVAEAGDAGQERPAATTRGGGHDKAMCAAALVSSSSALGLGSAEKGNCPVAARPERSPPEGPSTDLERVLRKRAHMSLKEAHGTVRPIKLLLGQQAGLEQDHVHAQVAWWSVDAPIPHRPGAEVAGRNAEWVSTRAAAFKQGQHHPPLYL